MNLSHFNQNTWIPAVVTLLYCISPAFSQVQEARSEEHDADKPAPVLNPLAGPDAGQRSVSASEAPETTRLEMDSLVELTFDGRVVRIGPDPIRTILDRMQLTPEQQQRFEEIRIERSLLLDRLAREHYAMLLEFGAAASSGEFDANPISLALNLDELARAFEEFFARGSLLTEMHDVLTPQQRWQASKTLGAYRKAQIKERQRLRGDERGRWEILTEIHFDELGEQLEESFQSRAAMMQDDFDQYIRYLALTPEQVAKVGAIYQEIGVREFLGEEVSGAEQLAAYTHLHDILTQEQRIKVRKLFLAGGRVEEVLEQ